MGKIHGIPVTLITKEITGYDPLGEPITEDVETVVDNVIVSPTTKDDIEIINEIRHYPNLYAKLIKDVKRYVSLIVKKMR